MKIQVKNLRQALLLIMLLGLVIISRAARADSNVYRLYNPNSGEHFYTTSYYEALSLGNSGWNKEGVGWVAPDSGTSVYRVYNPNSGIHFYTGSAYERDSLVSAGWRNEAIAFYSGGTRPIYRAYNPNSSQGLHNFTASSSEQQNLVESGWKDEGTPIYGTDISPYSNGARLEGGVSGLAYFLDPTLTYANVTGAVKNWMYTGWDNPIMMQAKTSPLGTAIDLINGGAPDGCQAWTLFYDSAGNLVTVQGNMPTKNYAYARIETNKSYSSAIVMTNGTIIKHELGHAFGLTHRSNPGLLMYFSKSVNDNFTVDKKASDDVTALYGGY